VAQVGHRELEHRLGLDVGDLPELLHQFGDIDESGKPGMDMEAVAGTVRGQFHRRYRLTEGAGPGIEMVEVQGLQRGHLQVPLHGEHLGDAICDGRAGGKHHPTAAVHLLDMEHFQQHVEGPLGGGLRQTGDAGHLRDVEQVFEAVSFRVR